MNESIEKLREYGHSVFSTCQQEQVIYALADEIEREIDERYMELPLDADGVPIHVGDIVYSASTPDGVKVGWVDSLSFCDTSAAYRNADAFRHKRRTIEDVLRDVWKEALDYEKSDIWRNPDEVFVERAAEIRELMKECKEEL